MTMNLLSSVMKEMMMRAGTLGRVVFEDGLAPGALPLSYVRMRTTGFEPASPR